MTDTAERPPSTEPVDAPADSVFHKFPHFPALDGVRGLAVAAVLVFHGGFSWASGGFLGVSTFFTLSGFLITSLLLSEQRREGHIALGAFWVRRFKRLMPAAIAAIGSIYVFWTLFPSLHDDTSFTDVSVLERLNGDLLAALVYVANWRFAFPPEGAGYENLFGEVGEPSPAAHFWSLSVEEQFYVFFPLIAMILLSKLRLSRGAFAGVLGLLLVASVAMLVPLSGFDRIYNGTDIRAAEILVGALLAVAFATTKGRSLITTHAGFRALGAAALALSVLSWVAVDLGFDLLLTGGLFIYGLLTVALICGATQSSGFVYQVLSQRPIRWLGEISYGAYLYHWPIFRWVDEDSTGLSITPLFGLRMALTFALAWISLHFLENPVRRGEQPGARVRSKALAAGVAMLFVAVMAIAYSDVGRAETKEFDFAGDGDTPALIDDGTAGVVVVEPEGSEGKDGDPAGETSLPIDPAATETTTPRSTTTTPPATTTTVPATLDGPAPVIMVVGDSLADNLYNGLARRAAAVGGPAVGNATFGGCGLAIGGEIQWPDAIRPACRQDNEVADRVLIESGAELVILVGGPVDLLPRRLSPEDEFDLPDSAEFAARLEQNYSDMQDRFLDQGIPVLWINVPCVEPGKAAELGIVDGAIGTVNEIITRVVASGGSGAYMFDLHGAVCSDGVFVSELAGDPNAREDGLHFSDFIADSLADQVATEAHKAKEFHDRSA